jgi:hypothetical protein
MFTKYKYKFSSASSLGKWLPVLLRSVCAKLIRVEGVAGKNSERDRRDGIAGIRVSESSHANLEIFTRSVSLVTW